MNIYDKGDEDFADRVRQVLDETDELPDKFKNFIVQHNAANPVPVGAYIAPSHNSTGLGDAIQGTRYVGATTSGSPTTGYFKVGDFVIDQSGDVWICTVAGDPGTWVDVKGGVTSANIHWCRTVFGDVQPSGVITNPTGGTAMPIISFSTNDPSNFTQVDANTISLPAETLVLTGYMQQDGGSPVTTNGDVACYVARTGGVTMPAFAESGEKVLQNYLAYVLTQNPVESGGGDWTAWATGSDTHFWDLVVVFYGIF